jgi:phosphoglycerol transferase MdoB-like AlkP superfamily enzyme
MVWNQMSSENRAEYFEEYGQESDEYLEEMHDYRTHMNAEYQKSLDLKVKRLRKRDEFARKKLLVSE